MLSLPETLRRFHAPRALLGAGTVAIGLTAGWAAPSHTSAVAAMLVVVAAANGYSKAYSP